MSDINTGAAAASALSAVLAAWLQQFSLELFGISVSSLVAAFAGAIIVLSIVQPVSFVRAVIRICAGTIAAAFSTPLVAGMLPSSIAVTPKIETGIALILGLFVLLFIEGAVEVVKKLPEDIRSRFVGKP